MCKIILHLCADIGSDSHYYDLHEDYKVIRVGSDIGVENFNPPTDVYGIIANPPCTEFSTAGYDRDSDITKGMYLVDHCNRIIEEAEPKFWVMENPARGTLYKYIGKPREKYQPWEYGSPWTKHTALWGNFVMPDVLYTNWEDVPKNLNLYVRKSRGKPSLATCHKNDIRHFKEYQWCVDKIKCDADIRSLNSDGFAQAFFNANR